MHAKRAWVFALCAAMLLCLLPVRAVAADGRCSLTIESRYDGAALAGRTFSLYAVAEPAEEGGYAYLPAFAGCGVALPDTEDAASWAGCASALWRWAQQHGTLPDAQLQTDAEGRCTFQDLAPGLYLVAGADVARPEGTYTCAPFLVCLPGVDATGSGRAWDVTAVTKDAFHPAEPDRPNPPEPGPEDPSEPVQPDKPDSPSEPDAPSPDDDRLPQTGQLNWPVPVLAGAGLALFLAGLVLLRRHHA